MTQLVENILLESQINVENLFNGHDANRYSFIWRDVTKYNTIEKKRKIVNYLETQRLKSGADLPIATLNPQMFVATQKTINGDNLKNIAKNRKDIGALPMVVKLNGVYYLLDGHHRTSVALITSKDYIQVRFLDLDNEDFI